MTFPWKCIYYVSNKGRLIALSIKEVWHTKAAFREHHVSLSIIIALFFQFKNHNNKSLNSLSFIYRDCINCFNQSCAFSIWSVSDCNCLRTLYDFPVYDFMRCNVAMHDKVTPFFFFFIIFSSIHYLKGLWVTGAYTRSFGLMRGTPLGLAS